MTLPAFRWAGYSVGTVMVIVSQSDDVESEERRLLGDTYSSSKAHTKHSHHPFVSTSHPRS